MEGTGFGGRQLAEAHRIWLDMLGDNTTIMVAGSGALIPAGMRRLLAYVIKNRFVDVLVLSGSLLFHDLHETLGPLSLPGPSEHDRCRAGCRRRSAACGTCSPVTKNIAKRMNGSAALPINSIRSRPYSTREFLHLLGRELAEIATEDGVLTSAYKARVPIFCPGNCRQRHRGRHCRGAF